MTDTIHAADSAMPLVVGIGGTTRLLSSTDRSLRIALQAAQEAGARTFLFDGAFLSRLPHYAPENPERNEEQRQLVGMARKADGLIVASPGYHGGVSGLVKTPSTCSRICGTTSDATSMDARSDASSTLRGGRPA
jgi:hypothetical protein